MSQTYTSFPVVLQTRVIDDWVALAQGAAGAAAADAVQTGLDRTAAEAAAIEAATHIAYSVFAAQGPVTSGVTSIGVPVARYSPGAHALTKFRCEIDAGAALAMLIVADEIKHITTVTGGTPEQDTIAVTITEGQEVTFNIAVLTGTPVDYFIQAWG
jgi:hypothetical protein